MRLTSLILSATACYNALAAAQDNYSLWPRRPAELEQAQRLIRNREYDDALRLLAPFVQKSGLAGHEARQLAGAIQTRRYLSANNPHATIYTVRRGDNIERVAVTNRSTSDLITLINGLMNPSALRVGQKLCVIPHTLRAELHPTDRELSVWDDRILVATYDIIPSQDLVPGANAETTLKEIDGQLNGMRLPRSSPAFSAANRVLKLADGTTLSGADAAPKAKSVRMNQRDVNELSLLLGPNARISIVRDEKSYDPFPDTTSTSPASANK